MFPTPHFKREQHSSAEAKNHPETSPTQPFMKKTSEAGNVLQSRDREGEDCVARASHVMMNVQATRLLTRAALFAPAGDSAHLTREISGLPRQEDPEG